MCFLYKLIKVLTAFGSDINNNLCRMYSHIRTNDGPNCRVRLLVPRYKRNVVELFYCSCIFITIFILYSSFNIGVQFRVNTHIKDFDKMTSPFISDVDSIYVAKKMRLV